MDDQNNNPGGGAPSEPAAPATEPAAVPAPEPAAPVTEPVQQAGQQCVTCGNAASDCTCPPAPPSSEVSGQSQSPPMA